MLAIATGSIPARTGAETADIPAWLQQHVGTDEGQIAPIVLQRARALHQRKRREGVVQNPCYLAKDATRPSTSTNGQPNPRFYVICEQSQQFQAVSSGYGNGRSLPRADFSNNRQCARHFSNAEGSKLTMGGTYLTAETRTSFKGYYSQAGQSRPFNRTFLLFDGEGETRNARERAIGGHEAVFLKWQCRGRKPDSAYADEDGYVPYGRLVDYTGGRSNGCTTWSSEVSDDIISLVEGNPTSLYIYPESEDIDAVARAVRSGTSPSEAGLYWNSTCLAAIGEPKFWPKRQLQPIIDEWRRSLPPSEPLVLPICR
ncbi:murein L,D-transpeptidase catalytic domain family protein [Roseivivax jejudonensis]|nr:murein L,D-transpeptidase catalytic domain family protein [Roseivivax jejudonensis]